jgi:helix-turn-helix protein
MESFAVLLQYARIYGGNLVVEGKRREHGIYSVCYWLADRDGESLFIMEDQNIDGRN